MAADRQQCRIQTLAFSVLILGLSEALITQTSAKRLLAFPLPYGHSHLMGLKKQAEEIADRGHEVMYLATQMDVDRLQPTELPTLIYTPRIEPNKAPPAVFRITASTDVGKIWKSVNGLMADACIGLLEDAPLMAKVKEFNPDLMLGEIFYPCSTMLAARLDIPWINYWGAAAVEPHLTSLWRESSRRLFVPNPISYLPQLEMRVTTQIMTFWQRLRNLYHFWDYSIKDWRWHSRDIKALYKHFGFDADTAEVRQRLVLSIAPVDWAAEWVRPLPPNFKMVGPILAEPGKPLPDEIEAFLESSGESGTLLVVLGTVAELDVEQKKSMAAVFASLPCKVLWRLSKKEIPDAAAVAELGLGNNTKVMTWLPQNDVLAHPRTKAFLSHVGINSMYEALYHGKPVIAMPFFGDQPSNADRVVAKGFGEQVSPLQAGTPAFKETVLKVLTNPKYGEAARALSVKINARKRTPIQEAADWIEHVMETGGDPYLRTPEDRMSVIARHSLDVYGLVVACFGLAAFLIWKLLRVVAGSLLKLGLQNHSKMKSS